MNTRHLPALLTALAALCLASPRLLAQGALVPAGPPGPTFKTLNQVEPRTPLVAGSPGVAVAANGTITINASGSYYLTGNLTIQTGGEGVGINIKADGVTLDLNGFTIRSLFPQPTGAGINVSHNFGQSTVDSSTKPGEQIIIRNGHIISGSWVSESNPPTLYSDGGFSYGIWGLSNTKNLLIEKVTISGVSGDGIRFTPHIPAGGLIPQAVTNVHVTGCIVTDCGGTGIGAGFVDKCSVIRAVNIGIEALDVRDSSASAGLIGIKALTISGSRGQSLLHATQAQSSITGGIVAEQRATDCSGSAIGARSIGVSAKLAVNCLGVSTTDSSGGIAGIGLNASVAHNCVAISPGNTLVAVTATGCYTEGPAPLVSNKYNMPQ